jgi:hypothetical protein
MIEGTRHFQNHKLYRLIHLPPHAIITILGFSLQLDFSHNQILRNAPPKKVETYMPLVS